MSHDKELSGPNLWKASCPESHRLPALEAYEDRHKEDLDLPLLVALPCGTDGGTTCTKGKRAPVHRVLITARINGATKLNALPRSPRSCRQKTAVLCSLGNIFLESQIAPIFKLSTC